MPLTVTGSTSQFIIHNSTFDILRLLSSSARLSGMLKIKPLHLRDAWLAIRCEQIAFPLRALAVSKQLPDTLWIANARIGNHVFGTDFKAATNGGIGILGIHRSRQHIHRN